MTFFGPDLRNGLPIGLGSVAGFGTTPRPFSPASLFTGGVQGAWYDPSDSTTLFSDRAGTTPCGTPGGGSVVPVGLMLDKSQGLMLGSELVTAPYSGAVSGGFSITSTSVVRDGVTAGGTASLTLSTTLTANAFYQVTFTAAGLSGDNTIIRVGSTASGNFYRITTAGTYTIYLPAGGTAAILGIAPFAGTAGGITLTNISVRALPGNHAIAANDTTARPELRARVNLLTYSEQFDNAAWVKTRTTVSANTTATTDPLGGNTADKIVEGVFVGNDCSVDYGLFTHTASVNYTLSVYAKAAERTRVVIVWSIVGANNPGIIVDLSTGTAASTNGSPTVSISNAGNGWWRIALTVTSGTPVTNTIRIGPTANTTSFTGTLGYNGDGTSGIYLWGAQLTATNEFPANTYQRISDANTYDAVGFPRYLACNGTSSAMSTPGNVNLSGTDKVTVFAGVRKLSDAAVYPTIVEFSVNSSTNNGSFSVYTSGSSTPRYPVYLFGTASTGYEPQTYAAPISNVLAVGYDIGAADRSTEVIPRINGVVNQTNPVATAAAGTGNFGSYPLFIGARNTSSLFLNGNIYSLIVVGSAVSAGQISATEQWVAGKTGITI